MPKSKLSKAIKDVTGRNLSDEQIFADVYNSMTDTAQQLSPADAGSTFQIFGHSAQEDYGLVADYLKTAAKKYGVIYQKAFRFKNPLAFFKKGLMPAGGKIEVLVNDIIKPKVYAPHLNENPFAREFNEVKASTYTWALDKQNQVTVTDTIDVMYFQNLYQFNNFIDMQISALVNGHIWDEYYHTKLALPVAIEKDEIPTAEFTTTQDLLKAVQTYSRKLTYMSSEYNKNSFIQATPAEEIVVLINIDDSVNIDIEYIASAFNPEILKNRKVRFVEVDEFPSVYRFKEDTPVTADMVSSGEVDGRIYPVGSTIPKGTLATVQSFTKERAEKTYDGSLIGAIVMNQDMLQLYDQLPLTITSLANPKDRYVNIFGNRKTYFAFVSQLSGIAIVRKSENGNGGGGTDPELVEKVEKNTKDIATNTESIKTAKADIETNKTNIETNKTNIGTNKADIDKLKAHKTTSSDGSIVVAETEETTDLKVKKEESASDTPEVYKLEEEPVKNSKLDKPSTKKK